MAVVPQGTVPLERTMPSFGASVARVVFRDDRLANRARVDELERELIETRQKLETKDPNSQSRNSRAIVIVFAVALLLLAGALVAGFVVSGSAGELAGIILTTIGGVGVSVGVILVVVSRLLIVVLPNRMAILSGRQHMSPEGPIGYRVIRGGRALRIPILEQVDYMDLTNRVISLEVRALSRNGTPVSIRAVANAKVASDPPLVHHAIERFLGQGPESIERVLTETLEGALRGVVAQLDPSEIEQNQLRVADQTLHQAEEDLRKLGLVVDTMKIRSVD